MTTISAVTQIEELSKRLDRAREIVGQDRLAPVVGKEGHYVVQACRGGYYLVNGECTCRDAQYRSKVHKGWCKHMLAVEVYKETLPQVEEPAPVGDGRSLDEQLKDLF